MAQAEKITFKQFQKRFSTEESCREFLYQQRFPDGFVCPKCGCREYYPIYRRGLCQCKQCRKQTSVTSGTVMHHTHLPLVLWFWAIYLCANDKRGISAAHLANLLDIGYESAWYNCPVRKSSNPEQTSLGAWSSAAVALGIYADHATAIAKAKADDVITEYAPVPEWAGIYKEKRAEMNRIYSLLYKK